MNRRKVLINKNFPIAISERLEKSEAIELLHPPKSAVDSNDYIKSYIEFAAENKAVLVTTNLGYAKILGSEHVFPVNVLQIKAGATDADFVSDKIVDALNLFDNGDAIITLDLRMEHHIRVFPYNSVSKASRDKSFDFARDGFLSPEIFMNLDSSDLRVSNLTTLCLKLNKLAIMRIQEIKFSKDDKKLVTAALLFARASTSFQAGAILGALGMEAEARSQARNCIEAAITGYALAKCPELDIVGALDAGKTDHYKKMMKAVNESLSLEPGHPLNTELLKILAASAEIIKGQINLNISTLAEKAGIRDIYDTIYRYLSADSSHATWDSLTKVGIQEDGKLVGICIQPRTTSLGETLLFLAICQITALKGLQLAFPDEEVDELVDIYYEVVKSEGLTLFLQKVESQKARDNAQTSSSADIPVVL